MSACPMTNHLRHLALTVDEQEPGEFYWTLMESKHDASVWAELASSTHSYLTWRDAWSQGSAALLRRVPDDIHGPRTDGEDEDAPPVG